MSFFDFFKGFKYFLLIVVPFLLLAIAVELIYHIPDFLREMIANNRAKAAGLDKVDLMDGEMFERWLAHQFERAGYKVRRTPYQGDHGADLILTAKNGTRIAVQAKNLTSKYDRVGTKAIGEVLRGKIYYECNEAMIVTNQGYTQQAIHEARKIGVKLVDRKGLIKFVETVNSKNKK